MPLPKWMLFWAILHKFMEVVEQVEMGEMQVEGMQMVVMQDRPEPVH